MRNGYWNWELPPLPPPTPKEKVLLFLRCPQILIECPVEINSDLEWTSFLGPRGPLRTPLVPVVVPASSATKIPDSKLTQPLISFPSDSKLKQPLPQYKVHRTLNRINSRTFLAQFGLVYAALVKINQLLKSYC